jgi:glycerate 2-kinase
MVAREIAGMPDIQVMCVGSDGMDGATGAAGAIVDGATWARLAAASVDGERALSMCDAGPALAAVDASLVTGPTGVNHADLMIIAAGL